MDTAPTWDWTLVNDAASNPQPSPTEPEPKREEEEPPRQTTSEAPHTEARSGPTPRRRRHGSRTCRICLETVLPTYPEAPTSAFNLGASSSKPTYVSEDPDLGRLLSPCKCKGSQRYVHEGCLNAWRLSNPAATRNYWQCPTCKFTYQFARLQWAALLSSRLARLVLTIAILFLCVFTLGFVADPILDMWFDPLGTIGETVSNAITDAGPREPPLPQERTTWGEHFVKGFFSLGLVGFFKSALAMSPWINLRGGGMFWSGRRGGTGRARTESINILLVLIGIATFLMGIWRAVGSLSTRVLKRVSDKVLDIGEGEDDDDDEPADDIDGESRKDQ